MLTHKPLFLQYLAKTSSEPIMLEPERAKGIYIYDIEGKKYIDLISGISVSNIGHCNTSVSNAVKKQLSKYSHLMVYGEYVQSPQVLFAKMLSTHLPENLNSVYFVNSGSEAVEGALKLSKRYTGRTEIIAFKNSYHGSTYGAMSVTGNENYKSKFQPLLPDVKFLKFDSVDDLKNISRKTACVIAEPIQGEAGVIIPENDFLKQLRKKCTETGTLLVLDEAQTGFGRTGSLFAFEQFGVTPDILCLAKAIGGGMPLGAFISSKKIMSCLSENPALGHITTFGGHPVSCAAAIASLEFILKNNLIEKINKKEKLFRELLVHHSIKEIRSKGLMFAVDFGDEKLNKKIIINCIANGIITDWFLFNAQSMRIAPPLTITEEQIKKSCEIILKSIC
ncbi:MAG: aspartate aminotransferase family protein [Bacteroidales bacterium]|jgi:acetylornithine/succinyldiaminopimelate/putrescine aminotransferase